MTTACQKIYFKLGSGFNMVTLLKFVIFNFWCICNYSYKCIYWLCCVSLYGTTPELLTRFSWNLILGCYISLSNLVKSVTILPCTWEVSTQSATWKQHKLSHPVVFMDFLSPKRQVPEGYLKHITRAYALVLPNSLFTYHPVIFCYLVQATGSSFQ